MLGAKLIATIDDLAAVAMRSAPVPGLAVALVDAAGETWTSAYGVADAEAGGPVRPDTLFEAASITKPVVALCTLALVRDGVLSLDRPLDSYVAEPLLPADPRAAAITARMVLGHTTGLPNWRRRGEPLALLRAPGSRFGYSGEGYVYLQRAIEGVTGTTLDRVCDQRVLGPLGMGDSSLVWREEMEARAARGHNKSGVPVTTWEQKPASANAAYSLQTTAPDLARLVGVMLKTDGGSGVGAATGSSMTDLTDAMVRPHAALHGPLAWGLGWGLQLGPTGTGTAAGTEGEALFWHWGDNFGFKAFAAGSRARGLGIVVLTNGNAGLAAAERLVQAVLPELDEPFDALRDFDRYVS